MTYFFRSRFFDPVKHFPAPSSLNFFVVLMEYFCYSFVSSLKNQASLEGGLASILRGQPLEVLHGSQVSSQNQIVNHKNCIDTNRNQSILPSFHNHPDVGLIRDEGFCNFI